jgi:hypothetical protein
VRIVTSLSNPNSAKSTTVSRSSVDLELGAITGRIDRKLSPNQNHCADQKAGVTQGATRLQIGQTTTE